jgi:ubiquinone/menaquinone biosynthesis C-methylase UbiE
MPTSPEPAGERGHYSYAHYASREVAEGFDALRFGGPIGRFLVEEQERLLIEALAPLSGRSVVDVGTGTGRAAIFLAQKGARVIGLDASAEMLDVARVRASEAGVSVTFDLADAHSLPLDDRSVDAAVCFRVLMHAIEWPKAVWELCRVARHRVVLDFPSSRSAAALESAHRRRQAARGKPVEAYRVLAERDVTAELERHGFRVTTIHRQFVLPINLHKKIGRLAVTRRVEGALRAAGLLAWFGSPVTMVAER